MSALREWLADLRERLSWRRARASRRLSDWIDPLAGTDELRRENAAEIAADDVADSAGGTVDAAYASAEDLEALEAEGVFDEPVELSPELRARADAAREELLAHAQRVRAARKARRRVRRERVLALASTMLLALAVAAAGAAALISGSTGIESMDRLLGIYEKGLSDPGQEGERPQVPSQAPPNLEPRAGASRVSVAVAIDASREAVGTAYPSVGGRICSMLVTTPGGDDRPLGARNCIAPSDLTNRLSNERAFIDGISVGDTTVLSGYAAEAVESVTITGPAGPIAARLSEAWTPDVADAETLRFFVATFAAGLGENGPDAATLEEIVDPGAYRISARLENGEIVESAPNGP